ncbi:apolipoprotein D-like [Macrosteles quadrilineatus]|uniref:apolipoprotein D-like n=1 Tax=Macrosteles quadrilineatus TaxID=74068 RepID=UPI0023E0E013|nr:apolipoprotein D-like [Macrosteles quadrilineatus]
MLVRLFILTTLVILVQSHSYHLGECPTVEPVPEFDMSKFLGKWYVIQKTSTSSRCLTYNFTATSASNEYDLEQVSEHPILGLASVDNKYHYTGHLTVPSADTPAKMVVKFPLSIAGTASYTVFFTDYTTYGAVFTCQKLLNIGHRQSATILSREKNLDKVYLDKIKGKLSAFGIDPYDLSRIDQSECPSEGDPPKVDININSETFSTKSIAGAVRKAGEKLGDGVEIVAEEAKKLYNTVSSKSKDKEELIENQERNQVEWLP